MASPLVTFSPNDLIYSYQLASRYRSPYIYDPSNALLKEPDIWEILQNDTDVLSIMQRRNQSIVRPWRVAPNAHVVTKREGGNAAVKPKKPPKPTGEFAFDEKEKPEDDDPKMPGDQVGEEQEGKLKDDSRRFAAICHEGLSCIDRFDAARRTLSEAFVLGRRYAEIIFEEREMSLDGTEKKKWFVPVHLKDVDRRRFHWVPEWDAAFKRKKNIHLEMFDTNTWTWEKLDGDQRRRYVEYIWQDTEDRLGYGRGAMEALFFSHYFKQGTLKKLMDGIDRYANGMLIGKLDSLRAASTDLSNTTLTTNMKTLLQTMRSEHVAVLQDGDSIELLEMRGDGLRTALELIRFFNESAERLCNGAVRQAGHSVDGTGSRASAETESDTAEQFYQFPREDLDSVLDRDLLGAFIYFNEHNFNELDLGEAKRPRFTSEQVKRQDPKTAVEIMNAVLSQGVPILTSEYYERAELTPPGPDEDVIEGMSMEMGGIGESEAVQGAGGKLQGRTKGQKQGDATYPDNVEEHKEKREEARFALLERAILERKDAPAPQITVNNAPPQTTINNTPAAPPQQSVTLHLPEKLEIPPPKVNVEAPRVTVQAPTVHVHTPQQEKPVANFTATVNVPETVIPAPVVNVHVPEQKELTTGINRLTEMISGFFGKLLGRKKEVTVTRQPDGSLKGEVREDGGDSKP